MLIRPSVGPDQPHEHAQRRRLAGAVGAEQAEHLAAAHLEGQVADGDEAVLVGLGHALEAQRHVLAVGLDGRDAAGGGAGPTAAAAAQPSRASATSTPSSTHQRVAPEAPCAWPRRPAGTARSRGAPAPGRRSRRRPAPAGRTPGRSRRRRAASCGRPRTGARSPAASPARASACAGSVESPVSASGATRPDGSVMLAAGRDVVELGEQGRRAARPRRRRGSRSGAPTTSTAVGQRRGCRTRRTDRGSRPPCPPRRRAQRPQSRHGGHARRACPRPGVTIGCAGPLTAIEVRRVAGAAVQPGVGAGDHGLASPPCTTAPPEPPRPVGAGNSKPVPGFAALCGAGRSRTSRRPGRGGRAATRSRRRVSCPPAYQSDLDRRAVRGDPAGVGVGLAEPEERVLRALDQQRRRVDAVEHPGRAAAVEDRRRSPA